MLFADSTLSNQPNPAPGCPPTDRLVNRCPAPEDYLALPLREEDSDHSVPPPPPPPEAMGDNSSLNGTGGASLNRLTAFRLFSSRDAPRPSDELGGMPPGGYVASGNASPSRSRAASTWGITTGHGPGGALSPHVLAAAFGGGVDGAGGGDLPDPLTVRLSVFNGRVYVSIRQKPQRLSSLTRTGSPLRRLGLRSQAGGGLSLAGMGGAGLYSAGGSNPQISNEASLAAGLAPLGSGPPSPTARGTADGMGNGGAAHGTGSGHVPMSSGGFAGGGGAAAAGAALSGGNAGALFGGAEPVMMVACGEGQTVCLCGQTR